jgi:hypothetical protein
VGTGVRRPIQFKGVNPIVAGHATAYRKDLSRYKISAVTFMEVSWATNRSRRLGNRQERSQAT